MNCNSTNGRLDIMNLQNLNQFSLYDKIPVDKPTSYTDALEGNWIPNDVSRAFFSSENIMISVQEFIQNQKINMLLRIKI